MNSVMTFATHALYRSASIHRYDIELTHTHYKEVETP